MSEDEGADYLGLFQDSFKGSYANLEQTQARMKAERRAGLTPKQRNGPKAPPKVQINFRATEDFKARLEDLAKTLGLTVTDVITRGIEELEKSHACRRGKQPHG